MVPAEYLALALKSLPGEREEALTASILGHSDTALHRYVPAGKRQQLTPEFASLATERMLYDDDQNLRIVYFRSLTGFAESPAARATIKDLLSEKVKSPAWCCARRTAGGW